MSDLAPHSAAGHIETLIRTVRGSKVILDEDIARLYGVETKALKRAVRRNLDRFPSDFMLQLTAEEYEALRRQSGTLKRGEHAKYLPFAFTEQGVAMLSSVLRSEQAVKVNIEIMRAFVRMRRALETHRELAKKLQQLEAKAGTHDQELRLIFDALKQLMAPKGRTTKRIGFREKDET